ncbi:MAG: TIGR04282 family arsenosugar biosynthesis glycosyltransferase, partial [Promethearchaeota archaeon]
SIARKIDSSRLLFYSDFIDENDSWDNRQFIKFLQKGNSFGTRMHKAFEVALKNHDRAVIIGSDCEELTPEIIRDAFNKLSEVDVVLGPAKDGGYYLMGLKRNYPELFTNKKWSTSRVLADTLSDIKKLELSFYLLPVLSDIDDYEDFIRSKLSKKLALR